MLSGNREDILRQRKLARGDDARMNTRLGRRSPIRNQENAPRQRKLAHSGARMNAWQDGVCRAGTERAHCVSGSSRAETTRG